MQKKNFSLTHYLKNILGLTVKEKKNLANVLLECYIGKFLQYREESSVNFIGFFQIFDLNFFKKKIFEQEFLNFLRSNRDYDPQRALELLLENNFILYFLEVAHAFSLIEKALKMMAERGLYKLKEIEFQFLEVDKNLFIFS